MTSYMLLGRGLWAGHAWTSPRNVVSPRSFKPAVGSPAESGSTEPSLTGLAGPTGPRLQRWVPPGAPQGQLGWVKSHTLRPGRPGWGGATTHGEAPSVPSAPVLFRVEGLLTRVESPQMAGEGALCDSHVCAFVVFQGRLGHCFWVAEKMPLSSPATVPLNSLRSPGSPWKARAHAEPWISALGSQMQGAESQGSPCVQVVPQKTGLCSSAAPLPAWPLSPAR